mmetsp:Transcript_39361/g.76850  ORF Transcript_39361/g.76850 Transcript_39361/m.76850 type:complete len:357 (+) Transcript_39361:1392-2462(+)
MLRPLPHTFLVLPTVDPGQTPVHAPDGVTGAVVCAPVTRPAGGGTLIARLLAGAGVARRPDRTSAGAAFRVALARVALPAAPVTRRAVRVARAAGRLREARVVRGGGRGRGRRGRGIGRTCLALQASARAALRVTGVVVRAPVARAAGAVARRTVGLSEAAHRGRRRRHGGGGGRRRHGGGARRQSGGGVRRRGRGRGSFRPGGRAGGRGSGRAGGRRARAAPETSARRALDVALARPPVLVAAPVARRGPDAVGARGEGEAGVGRGEERGAAAAGGPRRRGRDGGQEQEGGEAAGATAVTEGHRCYCCSCCCTAGDSVRILVRAASRFGFLCLRLSLHRNSHLIQVAKKFQRFIN